MRYSLRLVSHRNPRRLEKYLQRAGVTPAGVRIMASKARPLVIRVDNVSAPAANIIKQQLLSLGGEAAVHRDVIAGMPESSTVYIIADEARLEILSEKLGHQPFDMGSMGEEIRRLVETAASRRNILRLPDGLIDLSKTPVIAGILNVTPDSFSDGGEFIDPGRACDRALRMEDEGAGIIDIGGESTRPGSTIIDAEEEKARVIPVIERLNGRLSAPISIDTSKAEVASAAVAAGASIINDITGMTGDPEMPGVALETGAAVIVMHMKGTPETMQENPIYDDPVDEIISSLDSMTSSLLSGGIAKDKIIIDPGIGFGKRLQDNLEILDQVADFGTLGFPVMVGYSRKSFIGSVTGRPPEKRVYGGMAALAKCLDGGVSLLRVHDVLETADFIKVWEAIEEKG